MCIYHTRIILIYCPEYCLETVFVSVQRLSHWRTILKQQKYKCILRKGDLAQYKGKLVIYLLHTSNNYTAG